ncbi:hypothetical protein BGZ60DRAFT_68703 [Tricladium varicosporioides]|nr:hypothetical protein BGZ60DRAFT_68703 [Hymenoscyphus varicosporioides]
MAGSGTTALPGPIVNNESSLLAGEGSGVPSRPDLSLSNTESAGESSDDSENMATADLAEDPDESIIELSMSRAATRIKSPTTPAVEKVAAMDDIEGGGYFDSDPETPPEGYVQVGMARDLGVIEAPKTEEVAALQTQTSSQLIGKAGLSLGKLPSPKAEAPALPTPWHAGPRQISVRRAEPTQSALSGVFNSRRRSSSGSGEMLKKFLPKGLPSMPSISQVGNIFGTSSQKESTTRNMTGYNRVHRASSISVFGTNSATGPLSPRYQSIVPSQPHSLPREDTGTAATRPKTIRRVTSDDSLLYHSLSRASSLGDDTRFENHREQVNSRVKAIRDSLQDRSSFRMPQMPTMPSMPSMPRVPSFSFNMNFLNANNIPTRWRSDTDIIPDILPGNIVKKKPNSTSKPSVASGMATVPPSQPRSALENVRSITDGPNSTYLDNIMEHLTGDIVIMGGYRGSVLRSAKTHRQVWVPVKVGLNIRKVDLEVGLEPEDEEKMPESIYASGMLQNIGPVDISKRLFKRLSECENAQTGKLRVWDYGYDWRLSPALLSRKLEEFLQKLPSNQPSADGAVQRSGGALVVAHSLGGLITRHVVNRRPELFSGVVYAGVPQACVNILGPLRNGDAVLLSSRVLTAQVNFTLRTSFVLLPEDGGCFIDINTKEKYPVDFFNIDDWIKYRFSPCTDPPLPPRNQPAPSGLGGLLNMSSSLLSLPIPGKKSTSESPSPTVATFSQANGNENNATSNLPPTKTTRTADTLRRAEGSTDRTLAPQMGSNPNPVNKGQSINNSVSTLVTIPRPKAIAYLQRTLAETKKFKQELHHIPSLSDSNRYPPLALIYGKAIPTVYGAKVDGREGIPCSDVYDNLAFASGDGVCLAKEAMLPSGYKAVYGGRISSDRGHVTLLGDLNAVGRAIEAVIKGRRKGIGLGVSGHHGEL